MKRFFTPILAAFILIAFAGIALAQAEGQKVTVAEAIARADGSLVVITGYVVEDLGSRKYMFEDTTGRIEVHVGFFDGSINRQLRALQPTDLVEIFGDVHDEGRRNPIHVHVKTVTRL